MITCKLFERESGELLIKFRIVSGDFTFEKTYPLDSLAEIPVMKQEFKQFVLENESIKDLPEIQQMVDTFKCDDSVQRPIGYPI